MLANEDLKATMNATSVIETEDGNGNKIYKNISIFSASIFKNGRITINQSIQNADLYYNNTEIAMHDYDEFYAKVLDIAEKIKE